MSWKVPVGRRFVMAGVAAAVTGAGAVIVIAGQGPSGSVAQEIPAPIAAVTGSAPAVPSSGAAASQQRATAPGAAKPTSTSTRPTAKPQPPSRKQAADQAKAAVVAHRSVVRGVPAEEYRPRTALVDTDGSRHVRFDRFYRGLEVVGGDFIVHSGPDGRLEDTTLTQAMPITVSTKPGVNAAKASAAAAAEHTGKRAKAAPALVVDAGAGAPRLAWRVVLDGTGGESATVLVDARTGAVLRDFDNVRTEAGTGHGKMSGEVKLSTTRRDDGTFVLVDPDRAGTHTRNAHGTPLNTRPTEATSTSFTDDDNVWGDSATHVAAGAVDVHYGAQVVRDYLKEVHGRDGIRDDGKGPIAYLRDRYENASWNDGCFCMQFDAGTPEQPGWTSLDIVAHEMAHGVTGATANLTYSGESGGIDEASSDIFGTLVEFYAKNPADPGDYLVGEQRKKATGPLRYMDEPSKDGRSKSCWTPSLEKEDVHYSSGVGNKFFYTLAVGSGKSQWGDSPTCGGAPAVAGIGNDKAGQIWYRALTRYMVSYSNYSSAREATLKAAADLYGADGVEHKAVDAAWKAVAVDGSDPVATNPADFPILVRPSAGYGLIGRAYSQYILAWDRQKDPLTYTAVGLPKGLTMDPVEGRIIGVPTESGTRQVHITVKDPAGNAATDWFLLEIIPILVLKNPGPQAAVVDRPAILEFDTSHRGATATFTATGLPAGLTVSEYVPNISGTPTAAGASEVVFTVSDRFGQKASVTFTWTVYRTWDEVPPKEPTPGTTSGRPSSSGPTVPGSTTPPRTPPATGSTSTRPTPTATGSSSPTPTGQGGGGPAATTPAASDGPLPRTGPDVITLAGVGVVFIGAGLALLMVRRRKRPTA